MKPYQLALIYVLLFPNNEGTSLSVAPSGCEAPPCLEKIPKGYNFLKSYPLTEDGSSGKIETSYVLTKGTDYSLVVCSTGQGYPELEIFDSSRRSIIKTKLDKSAGQLVFPCQATGIYYLRFSANVGCGTAILAFSRK